MINFTGKYITQTNILKRNNNGYCSTKANIVELSPNEPKDLDFLKKTNLEWQNNKHDEQIISKIYRSAYICAQKDYDTEDSVNFFTITTRDKIDSLSAEDALAVGQVSIISDKLVEIDFCQVAPNCEYDAFDREYAGVGRALIKFIMNQYNKSSIVLTAIQSAQNFYKRLGFKAVSPDKTLWLLSR